MNALIIIVLVFVLSRIAKGRRSRQRQTAARQYITSPPRCRELRPVDPSPAELIERERQRIAAEKARQRAAIEAETRRRIEEARKRQLIAAREAERKAEEARQRQIAARREAERRAEETRRQAEQDMIHCDVMREQYMALYDELEAERDAADTTPRRRQQLIRQLIVLEEKLYTVERRKSAAYAKLQGV